MKRAEAAVYEHILLPYWDVGVSVEPLIQIHDDLLLECDERIVAEPGREDGVRHDTGAGRRSLSADWYGGHGRIQLGENECHSTKVSTGMITTSARSTPRSTKTKLGARLESSISPIKNRHRKLFGRSDESAARLS